nr:hypothetical protein [Tanacetum cinerariifolium]
VGTVVYPKTKAQKLAMKNELKAKSTLLLTILDDHLLKFHSIKNAKSLWEAIKIRFGGNKESKKMHKTVLKQQYKNFVASRSEGLDKTYDRFQKLISQLELNGEVISQEDANMKLLKSLPPAWNNIALIMRNKPDIETLSMDDLYNNLKVYETEIKGQSSSCSNSHNVAFVSSENTSSINETVTAAHDIHTAGSKETPSASSYADDVAMITMRVKKIMKRTGRNLNFNGKEPGNRRADNERRVVSVETPTSALVVQDGLGGYDWSYQAEEIPTDFALMAHSSDSANSSRSEGCYINGDSPVPEPPAVGTVVPPKTEAQKLARKNELKAKSTLLLAIPDEHLLKFYLIKDAKSLWEAIKIRFRGNKESKKIHKTILKQQYEKFVASRSKGLEKPYDRFQKLIIQLELNDEVISQEDANLKLLRSLPPTWNNIALIMRNKPDIETLSMDDLYNNLKVYEAEIKGQSSSISYSYNVAFVSSENTSSINENVNDAHDIPATGLKEQPSASSYVDDVMFFSLQVNQTLHN